MRTSYIFGTALIFFTLIFVVASLNYGQQAAPNHNLSAAALSQQIATPTPSTENISEVGSTDGIVIMGVVLVFVVTLPILFRKKKK
jgi:uncharacterized phage infection (PIP) family protein YhgE